jgi:hypothetical protein
MKHIRNYDVITLQQKSRERQLKKQIMTQEPDEVVGVSKNNPEPNQTTEMEFREVVIKAQESIKPKIEYDYKKYLRDENSPPSKKNYNHQFFEPAVRAAQKKVIVRPEAEYTQSASPYGIADELHRKKIKR